MLQFAVGRGLLVINPAIVMKIASVEKRERVLVVRVAVAAAELLYLGCNGDQIGPDESSAPLNGTSTAIHAAYEAAVCGGLTISLTFEQRSWWINADSG